jgi:hypothetical protein
MTPEERRALLDHELAVLRYYEALREAGLPAAGAFESEAALAVLAAVLVEIHGADRRRW